MTTLATIVAALALLVGALLLVPLGLVAQVRLGPAVRVRGLGRLTWLFGLVRVPLGSSRDDEAAASDRPEEAEVGSNGQADRRRRAWRLRLGTARDVLSVPGLGHALARGAVRILRCLRWQELHGWLVVGLEDPADTGELVGWLTPLRLALPRGERFALAIEPEFGGERLEGELEVEARLVPAELLAVAVRTLLSRPVLGVLWAVSWKRRRRSRALAAS